MTAPQPPRTLEPATPVAPSPADDWDRLFAPAVTPWEEPSVVSDAAPAAVRYLGFRIGTERYAVPIADLSEVVRLPPLTFVPRVRSFVRGVCSVRGTVLPIIDLGRRLLAGPEEPDATVPPVAAATAGVVGRQARVLVTRVGGEVQGLLVDEVDDVFVLDPEALEPPPAHLPRRLVELLTGVARHGERLHLLLDLRVVLDFTAPLPHARRRLEVTP